MIESDIYIFCSWTELVFVDNFDCSGIVLEHFIDRFGFGLRHIEISFLQFLNQIDKGNGFPDSFGQSNVLSFYGAESDKRYEARDVKNGTVCEKNNKTEPGACRVGIFEIFLFVSISGPI